MHSSAAAERQHWAVVSVLVLSSSLNYLDRSILSALLPTLKAEFSLSGAQVGWVLASFSLPYALGSPLMGLLIDRTGLRWGASLVVAVWSLAGMSTGFVTSLAGLVISRALLGFGESGGIPVTGKGSATYLPPKDRAFGSALSQVGLTLGMVAAPLITEAFAGRFGWRAAFVFAGALGFVWIPIWMLTSARVPALHVASDPQPAPHGQMLRDRRLLVLLAANMLAMTIYSLWTNWTTQFFFGHFGLTQREANLQLAWWPSTFAALGGLMGGWLVQRQIRIGVSVLRARQRTAFGASFLTLATAFAAIAPSPVLATAAISLSLFGTVCLSVNYYAVPLDLFGVSRAGFAVSLLTGSFGLMQFFLAPQIGAWSDRLGWVPVCVVISVLPLLSTLLLRTALPKA